jgi:hypothetical protein
MEMTMGLNGFLFDFSAVSSMAGTALFGGIFVMVAWLDVVRKRATTADWRIPTSLYPFTVSVIFHPIAFIWLSSLPDGHRHVVLKFRDAIRYSW